MKKITIIGRGTAGCFAAAFFAKQTDWAVDWIYDPNIKQQSVGEGTTVNAPFQLYRDLNFNSIDLQNIFGTPKLGIRKINWGKTNNDFVHSFDASQHGFHFNAVLLQEFIIKKLSSGKRVNIFHDHVTHSQLDTDFIIDCTGRPEDLSDFKIRDEIPVNAVSVKQCYWDGARFNQTLAIARPHGWVFGIPLINRCSIGYLYDKNISSLEQVEEDVLNVYKDFNLTPSQDGNNFAFGNYTRKQNFTDRVAYNGNASFFLEPMEATSMECMSYINSKAWQIFTGKITQDEANKSYEEFFDTTSYMIMLHYFAGSIFDTPFWSQAIIKANQTMTKAKSHKLFKAMIKACSLPETLSQCVGNNLYSIGTWPIKSYYQNLEGLGINERLNKFLEN